MSGAEPFFLSIASEIKLRHKAFFFFFLLFLFISFNSFSAETKMENLLDLLFVIKSWWIAFMSAEAKPRLEADPFNVK